MELPSCVLEYLEFLMSKFSNVRDAFKEIDGPGGNGVISLREFEESVVDMGCRKFKGRGAKQEIQETFRFLDPSGEGQVSAEEWTVLEQFWREIEQSIVEFVKFCRRTFGEDLQEAWNAIDEDGSGSITEDEWCDLCKKAGYLGPSKPIFNYLDKDDEGTVSQDEFEELGKLVLVKSTRS